MRTFASRCLRLSLVAVLLAAIGVQGASHAAVDYWWNDAFRTTDPAFPTSEVISSVLRYDFPAGDCTMYADSRIDIDITRNVLRWHLGMSTSHTNSADIWHATFRFVDKNSATLYTSPTVDGPPMSVACRVYARVIELDLAPVTRNLRYADQVEWKGAC